MKLNVFNPTTCGRTVYQTGEAVISFSVKGGNFRINKAAMDVLNVAKGDQITFHQDEETGEWYVEKVKEGGFVLSHNPKISRGLNFCNTFLGKAIVESLDYTGKSGRCELEEPVKHNGRLLFGLMTDKLINE